MSLQLCNSLLLFFKESIETYDSRTLQARGSRNQNNKNENSLNNTKGVANVTHCVEGELVSATKFLSHVVAATLHKLLLLRYCVAWEFDVVAELKKKLFIDMISISVFLQLIFLVSYFRMKNP